MTSNDNQHDKPCSLAIEMKTKIEALEEDKKDQWEFMASLSTKITDGIKELQEKYINRLPLWATFLITALCSMVTGFIVARFGK